MATDELPRKVAGVIVRAHRPLAARSSMSRAALHVSRQLLWLAGRALLVLPKTPALCACV